MSSCSLRWATPLFDNAEWDTLKIHQSFPQPETEMPTYTFKESMSKPSPHAQGSTLMMTGVRVWCIVPLLWEIYRIILVIKTSSWQRSSRPMTSSLPPSRSNTKNEKNIFFKKVFFFSNKIPISSYFRIFSVMSLSLDSNFSVMSLSLWLIWPCKFLRVEALYINTPTPVIMSVKVWAWGESFDIDSLKVYVGISVAGCEAWLLVLRQQWIFSSCLIRYIPKYDPEYVTPTVSKGQRAGAESRIVLDHES